MYKKRGAVGIETEENGVKGGERDSHIYPRVYNSSDQDLFDQFEEQINHMVSFWIQGSTWWTS